MVTNNLVQSSTMPATNGAVVDAASSTRRISDNRRSNKPIMEKRRRARINNSLNELKTLILDAMKKDPARHSKLEKADILEMTVKHLQNLQRQQAAMSAAADPSVVNKFRAGFSECATEVGRFPGLEPGVKRRLLQHLANCLNHGPKEVSSQVQVHILPSPDQQNGIILSNGNGAGVQLVPTRLANGELALLLPSSAAPGPQTTPTSPIPLLVPIPQRTSSTASAASSSSSNSSTTTTYTPSDSPGPMDITQNQQHKPLSLVVRKCEPPVEEKPWRPW